MTMITMPKHSNKLLLAALLGCGMSCHAGEIHVDKAENGIWVDGDEGTIREKWSRFAVCTFNGNSDEEGSPSYLIRQDFEVGTGLFEGYKPENLTLSAFPFDVTSGKIGKDPVWKVQTVGVNGYVRYGGRDFYCVEAPGCCDELDTVLYYSLRTGNFAGAATGRLLEIEIPNTPFKRFVMTQSDCASEWKGIKGAQFNVFYASKHGLLQSVGIILPEKLSDASRDYQYSFLGKDKADTRCALFGAKTIAGAAVVLESSLVTPFTITLPFGDDGFDISKVSMEGVEAEFMTEVYPAPSPDTSREIKQDNH